MERSENAVLCVGHNALMHVDRQSVCQPPTTPHLYCTSYNFRSTKPRIHYNYSTEASSAINVALGLLQHYPVVCSTTNPVSILDFAHGHDGMYVADQEQTVRLSQLT